jgi:serine/threonine protein kinase/class 3 adenylate cyclase
MVLELLADDPDSRPSARDVRDRLVALRAPAGETGVFPTRASDSATPEKTSGSAATVHDEGARRPATGAPPAQLGRYRLLEKVGQGGMGAVYRAEDVTDGTVVALKMLRPDWAAHPNHLRRFQKEARLLAEVNNPYIANLLEVNEDNGIHYLALEYVAGTTLGHWLLEHGRLDEKVALALLADVVRGLAPAHAAGIVHRDIKPENILLTVLSEDRTKDDGGVSASLVTRHSPLFTVKLSDFGLARHIVETESLNMTRAGAVLGTPLYMSPEQCAGQAVDARADIYALGATLYHMLAGRPPFEAATALALIAMHRTEPLPPLQKFNPTVSDAVCRVIDKATAKNPEARYPDAAALLEDLERLLRGEPSSIAVHPRLPDCDPARVLAYDFSWELQSSPALLWPHVSNTERLNRALGLSAVRFSNVDDSLRESGTQDQLAERVEYPKKRVRRVGRFHKAGMLFAWEEHPFEWIEARRMGVLREYSSGPFRWLVSIVELEPRPGGTVLHHRLRLEPRNLLGRTLAAVEVGLRTRRALGQLYQRIDRFLVGQTQAPAGPRPYADAFEEPAALPRARRKRLEGLLSQLADLGTEAAIVEGLGDFLATAPPQEVARIRPLALARRLGLDPDKLTAACLHGTHLGLLVLLWDILCPVCRIPSEVKETLRELRDHGHCDACQIDFELDFANSVEMIFRAHPEIRDSELATYCVGGPAHSPHVAAQARVAPGERIELDLSLGEGAYRLRGPQLPGAIDFRVEPSARAARWDLVLARPPGPELPRVLRAGSQLLALTNDTDRELLVRVERTAARTDALTAARASSLALFRELFPGEALSPGQLISVTTLTFLVTDLVGSADLYRDLGDARAFNLIHAYFRLAQKSIVEQGGALVKTVGEGMLAVFSDPTAAVRVALGLQGALDRSEKKGLQLRVGVHHGPALAATLNDHLDYFGATLSQAMRLPGLVQGGEVVLTEAVASDPRVAALLQGQGLKGTVQGGDMVLHCFRVPGR